MVLQPLDDPLVMSTNPFLPPCLYNHGFNQPRTGLPAASKASLTSEIIAAIVGVEALVPSTMRCVPFQI